MVSIVRNVHDRHSAGHPEASQNASHCERCVQSELSDMCCQRINNSEAEYYFV